MYKQKFYLLMYVYVTKNTELIFFCRKFKKYVNLIFLIAD